MRQLLTWRWARRLLALVVVVVVCVLAGRWQFSRYEERSARNDAVALAAARDPVPVAELVPVGEPPAAAAEFRRVTASGRYDAERTLVLRLRPLDGRPGSHVVVPLIGPDGSAVLVDRGWVSRDVVDADPATAPAPPTGRVTVVGRLRLPDTGGTGGDPASRLIRRLDVAEIAETLPYPVRGGYLELLEEDPTVDLAPVPVPAPVLGTGLHLAYAVQWWLFGAVAIVVFVLLARQEVKAAPQVTVRLTGRR